MSPLPTLTHGMLRLYLDSYGGLTIQRIYLSILKASMMKNCFIYHVLFFLVFSCAPFLD